MMLRSQKWSVGIDIGSTCMKMVCLVYKHGEYELKAYATYPVSHLRDIQDALRIPEVQNGSVRIGVQDAQMLIQKVEIPEVPKEEIEEVLKWHVRDMLKAPLEYYTIRFYPIGVSEEGKYIYTVFIVEKAVLQKCLSNILEFGIVQPKTVEPSMHALANAVIYNEELSSSDRFCVLDIGKSMVQLLVVSQMGILYYRPFSLTGIQTLIGKVAQELSVSIEQAEAFVLNYNNTSADAEEAHTDSILSGYLSKLSIEVQYSVEHFHRRFPNDSLHQILISGSGAGLKKIQKIILETTNLPVAYLNPFKRIRLGTLWASGEDSKALFGIAVGLAL